MGENIKHVTINVKTSLWYIHRWKKNIYINVGDIVVDSNVCENFAFSYIFIGSHDPVHMAYKLPS